MSTAAAPHGNNTRENWKAYALNYQRKLHRQTAMTRASLWNKAVKLNT